jgi:hypothetical protein
MPPAELFGIEPLTLQIEPIACEEMAESERLQRVRIVAKTIATQLATLIYCASDRADTDPTVLMEFVLRELNGNHSPSADAGGKST